MSRKYFLPVVCGVIIVRASWASVLGIPRGRVKRVAKI